MVDSDLRHTEQFIKLLTANQRRIFAFILSMVGNRVDAEDLLQEAALIMWQKFPEFQLGTDFVAWGVKIAKFCVLNHRKKSKETSLHFCDETLALLQKDAPGMLIKLDSRVDALESCVKQLPKTHQRLVLMRYHSEMPVLEIARRIGCSISSIYKCLSRAHEILVQCVRRRMSEEAL